MDLALLVKATVYPASNVDLGYPESSAIGLGIVLLCLRGARSIPSIEMLGATLLTGYLGGAVATQVRGPLFTHTLFRSISPRRTFPARFKTAHADSLNTKAGESLKNGEARKRAQNYPGSFCRPERRGAEPDLQD